MIFDNMRNKVFYVLALLLALCSCQKEAVRVTAITLDATRVTLVTGETYAIEAIISPSEAENQQLIWSTDDASVARVSDGVVTAVAPGTTSIVVRADDDVQITASCAVTVLAENIPVTALNIDKMEVELYELEQDLLTAAVLPADATDAAVKWESSDEAVATVHEGMVTARTAGSAVISVTVPGTVFKAECKVTVKCHVKGISLRESLAIEKGGQAQLDATVYPERASDKSLSWESSDAAVATVTEAGLVSAQGCGVATVTVTALDGEHTAECVVTVVSTVSGISLSHEAISLKVDEQEDIVATLTPSDPTNMKILWSSTDESVARLEEGEGKVTVHAVSKGVATICAVTEDGGHHANCVVTVRPKVDAIEIGGGAVLNKRLPLYISSDAGETVSAVVSPSDADVALEWKSDNVSVAQVIPDKQDDRKCVIRPVGKGNTIVTVSTEDGAVSDFISVSVKQDATGITVSPDSLVLWVGGRERSVEATILPSNSDATCSFSISGPVAEFKEDGNVCTLSAKNVGNAVLTARADPGGVSATCKIEVRAHVESLNLNLNSLTLEEGEESSALVATKLPSNAYEKVIWSSSAPEIASVDRSTGKVTALKAGNAVISAEAEGLSSVRAPCTVSVTPAAVRVVEMTVSPRTLTIDVKDEPKKLEATVYPEDATNKNVVWSSDNTSVATVDKNGYVTPHANGTATITATLEDGGQRFTGNCKVTVTTITATSIKLDVNNLTLTYNDTYTLKPTIKPDNAAPTVIWRSSDPSVATVSGGVVTAGSKDGTAVIQAIIQDSEPELSDECTVNVIRQVVKVTGVSVDPDFWEMYYGQTKRLTAIVSPANATDKSVRWSSMQGIVSVSQDGLVTPVRDGNARVTVTTNDGDISTTSQIVVKYNPVNTITIPSEATELVLKEGETYDLTVEVRGLEPTLPAFNPALTWTSSSAQTVTVSGQNPNTNGTVSTVVGRMTAVAAGESEITIKARDDSGATAKCKVKVIAAGPSAGGHEGMEFEEL